MQMLSQGRPQRVMINQPSTLQTYHKYHGMRGIAIPEKGDTVDVHFTEGAVHSMRVSKSALDILYISDAESEKAFHCDR